MANSGKMDYDALIARGVAKRKRTKQVTGDDTSGHLHADHELREMVEYEPEEWAERQAKAKRTPVRRKAR